MYSNLLLKSYQNTNLLSIKILNEQQYPCHVYDRSNNLAQSIFSPPKRHLTIIALHGTIKCCITIYTSYLLSNNSFCKIESSVELTSSSLSIKPSVKRKRRIISSLLMFGGKSLFEQKHFLNNDKFYMK